MAPPTGWAIGRRRGLASDRQRRLDQKGHAMSDTTEDFIYVRERRLPYETFDADNHMYENQDAMTKFLPPEYQGVIKYVDINGRTKLAIRDKISDYIPNPTFGRVAVP